VVTRRLARSALGWAAACALLGAGAGCPAAHGGYPTAACSAPADCFEGEACIGGACVPADDAAPLDDGGDDLTPSATDGAPPGDADAG
jgi:hypothetical protein